MRRELGEEETLLLKKGKLLTSDGVLVPTEGGGIEAQDQEFLAAIREGREPRTSCKTCLPTMAILDRLQRSMDERAQRA